MSPTVRLVPYKALSELSSSQKPDFASISRKESFQKAKGAFQDVVDSVGDTDEDNHDCESSEIESNEDADRNSDEEKLQRKLDFEAKQKLFNMN